MNKDNVLKVADAIEQHSIPDLGFNIGTWRSAADEAGSRTKDMTGRGCGTVACIAGWAEAIHSITQPAIDYTIVDFFGIREDQVEPLIMPDGWVTPESFPPERAVAVLRHLAETGEVDWSVADKVAA